MEHLSRNLLLLAFIALLASCGNKATHRPPVAETVVVAYVTSWTDVQPDPSVMTHINYAFGHVNETFDGVRIDNPQRLRSVVALKEKVPSLQVLLSVGGWESGGFSEMAADEGRRQRFADDCARAVLEYGLDGIDIDWEYPTQNVAGISASPHDTDNFTLLMRDLRHALGEGKLLTLATVCSAKYFDFPAFLPYVDFVNVMAYDMGSPNGHHAALYPSEHSGTMTSHEAVQAHLEAGERELLSGRRLKSGLVTIGATETALHTMLLPVLGRFHRAYPGIRLRITNHPTPEALEALRAGRVELALVSSPEHLGQLHGETLSVFRDVVVGDAAFAPLARRPLSLGELLEQPLVFLGQETQAYGLYQSFFAARGLVFAPDLQVDTTGQILPMVLGGLGLGFLPQRLAAPELTAGRVVEIRLTEPLPERNVCLVTDPARPLSPAAGTLCQMLLEERDRPGKERTQ